MLDSPADRAQRIVDEVKSVERRVRLVKQMAAALRDDLTENATAKEAQANDGNTRKLEKVQDP